MLCNWTPNLIIFNFAASVNPTLRLIGFDAVKSSKLADVAIVPSVDIIF